MITSSRHVTVAHISSESGDHELRTFNGILSNAQISQKVYESAPDWWEDPEYVYVEQAILIEFMP